MQHLNSAHGNWVNSYFEVSAEVSTLLSLILFYFSFWMSFDVHELQSCVLFYLSQSFARKSIKTLSVGFGVSHDNWALYVRILFSLLQVFYSWIHYRQWQKNVREKKAEIFGIKKKKQWKCLFALFRWLM